MPRSPAPSPTLPPTLPESFRIGLAAITFAAAAFLSSSGVGAAAAGTASLVLTFHGLKTGGGAVMASLARSPAAFDGKAAAAAQGRVAVAGETASITFSGLVPGRYAVRAFHDLDGDGKLGVNPFGVPTEPYAFSNDARGSMGPPTWEAAAFVLKDGQNSQTIEID